MALPFLSQDKSNLRFSGLNICLVESNSHCEGTVSEDESKNGAQLDVLSAVLPDVIAAFRQLNDEGREKLFRTIATLFSLGADSPTASTTPIPAPSIESGRDRFSRDRPISPENLSSRKSLARMLRGVHVWHTT